MTQCQACGRPTQLYLCEDCTTQLANMLDQIPWLLDELDARIQKLDRISLGTIGRNRRPDELNVMDFDAAEDARNVRKQLLRWVNHVAELHTGRTPPGLSTVTTPDLARWLHVNVHAIAKLRSAGALYRDIRQLVGTDTKRTGKLVTAINRNERHFAGPCPTTTGHDTQGQPVECGRILYADIDERTTTCPACRQDIDVEHNRMRAAKERDYQTEEKLLEVLGNCGEPVEPTTLTAWIKARRLRPAGRLHDGLIVPTHTHDKDPYVYSVKRARKLRARDLRLKSAKC